jgi:hypothetical protein
MLGVYWAAFLDGVWPWVSAFAITPDDLPRVIGEMAKYGLLIAAVYTAIRALGNLPLIKETMHEFNVGRGRIWDLKNTVDDLQRLEPVIKLMAERFERLAESVEIIRKQNIEAQLESTAERTDNGEDDRVEQPEATAGTPLRVRDDANWVKLRRFFLRNARRLQSKVEEIGDGRTRGAYDRIGWKRPRLMVEKLREGRLISAEAAQASLQLIERFNAFKPRHHLVPDEVVGALEVLDRQLEKELGPAPSDEELE